MFLYFEKQSYFLRKFPSLSVDLRMKIKGSSFSGHLNSIWKREVITGRPISKCSRPLLSLLLLLSLHIMLLSIELYSQSVNVLQSSPGWRKQTLWSRRNVSTVCKLSRDLPRTHLILWPGAKLRIWQVEKIGSSGRSPLEQDLRLLLYAQVGPAGVPLIRYERTTQKLWRSSDQFS